MPTDYHYAWAGQGNKHRRATSIQEGGGHAAPSGTVRLMVKAVERDDPSDPEGKRKILPVIYQDYDLPVPIPSDQFVPVEMTPTIAQALTDGDLVKEGHVFLDMPGSGEQPRPKARTRQHTPSPQPARAE